MASIKPFALERFFAKWEFKAPHLMCCSDCEPLLLSDLMEMATPDLKQRFNSLRLGYTETQGLPELRAAAAKQYTRIGPDDIVISAPEEGIYLAMRALLRPNDHVIVTFPGYQSLYEIAVSIGCKVTRWEPQLDPTTAAVRFDVSQLTELMTRDTRLVVCNFPHNPTGATLTHSEWSQLIETCKAHDCWLFSDEMYRLLELDPSTRLPCAADLYPRAVSLAGMSKSLSLPGLRLGWLACQDKGLLEQVMTLKDYTTICTAAPSEILALIALNSSDQIVQRNVDLIKENVEAFQGLVDEYPTLLAWTPPTASSVAFPRLLTGEDIESFCNRLVTETGALLLPSTVYEHTPSSTAGHFRLGLGRRDFKECLARLRLFLAKEAEA